jgi:hypothetical protein
MSARTGTWYQLRDADIVAPSPAQVQPQQQRVVRLTVPPMCPPDWEKQGKTRISDTNDNMAH